ncbi:MAG: heat-inducible transcription repressor HrcA [Alphaproteobacteria bacterium]|nr:MAG: heat-inducible transcription repressor HrcA [Alphaproteobacteria bacterium]
MSVPKPSSGLPRNAIEELDQRSRDVFRSIVDSYLATGEPTGSRTLSRALPLNLSPATIRNVMQDLELLGLIYAPHTSAGRLPTEIGMRFFVDSFLEIGDLTSEERNAIEAKVQAASRGRTLENVLAEAGQALSGLTHTAALVVTTKSDLRLKHIEFIRLDPVRALVVIVGENGLVENRIIALPPGVTASTLIEAANYINAKIAGRTIGEAKSELAQLQAAARRELDKLADGLVAAGIAVWAGTSEEDPGTLIVSGHANLLGDVKTADSLERIRMLFDELEAKENFFKLLELTEDGEGVRIFIGSENKLFSLSGSALVVAPYRGRDQKVIGALGIVGPTRLNYARIVPMVDFTARVVTQLLR